MNQKKLLIFLSSITFIFLLIVGFIIYGYINNDTNISINDGLNIEVEDMNVSIFEESKENVIIEEETDNIGNVSLTIDDEVIVDQLGNNKILKQTYVLLKDNYYLLEVLISKNGNDTILSDAELSLSYDNCKNYAKVWYIYNKETKQKYIFEDNTRTAQLSLNPKLTSDSLGNYLEFDKMFYFAGNTDVDHYKIDLDTLIAIATSNKIINFEEYSTINKADFSSENEIYDIDASKDLNGDGIEDFINLRVFDSSVDFNKIGFTLNVNDSYISLKNASTIPCINFIDLDKTDEYTEIMIVSSYETESSVQSIRIFYYDGTNIKNVFEGSFDGFNFELAKEVNELDFTLENGEISINTDVSDTVQNWCIKKVYALDSNHHLYEKVPEYYKNTLDQTVTARNNIVLYNTMNLNDKSDYKLSLGQESKLIGTTLDFWFVIDVNGSIYYIPLDNDGTIKDLGLFPYEIFTGLNATD